MPKTNKENQTLEVKLRIPSRVFKASDDIEIFEKAAAMREEAAANRKQKKEEIAKFLKRYQTLLLILYHAAICKNQKCEYSYFKKLWEHMEKGCSMTKTKTCKVHHCREARKVINHYEHCKHKNCKICSPVRKLIEKKEREKQAAELLGRKFERAKI